MLKKSILVIIVLILVVLASYTGYIYFTFGRLTSDFTVYNQIENPKGYPFVRFRDIRSGRLAKFLHEQESKNGIVVSGLETPLESVLDLNQALQDERGFNYIHLSGEDVTSGRLKNKDSRPFNFVSFYKTGIGFSKYLVLIQRWTNKDGTIVYIPYVIPESRAVTFGEPSDYFQEIINENKYMFLSPLYNIRSISLCKVTFPENDWYCNWQFLSLRNKKNFNMTLNNWKETAIAPKELERFPVLFKLTQYAYE